MKKTKPDILPNAISPIRGHHEDVWSQTKTVHGFAADEIRSVLQKSIRRGLVEEATLAAYEFYLTGPETEELLWRRLEVIATEDVGCGLINAPLLLEALNAQRLRLPHGDDRWTYSAHAVRLLATARKDRTSTELGAWAKTVVERGERTVEVLDYQIDHHTRRGRAMGRGQEHWRTGGGGLLLNQIEDRDTRWADYLDRLRTADGPKRPAQKVKKK